MPEAHLDLALDLQLGAKRWEYRLITEAMGIALVGPSGAGKTTLLRLLAGLERRGLGRLRRGVVTWQDSAAMVFVAPWDRKVGWVPQDALLFPHLNVRENLLYGGGTEAELSRVTDLLGIGHLLDRRPRLLSGGERQRTAVGRALLSKPQLLLMDEPLSAIHRPQRGLLAEKLAVWCRDHAVPFVLVSHDEGDVSALASEVWEIREGTMGRVR